MDGEADEMSYEYRPADAYLLKEMEYKKSLLIEEFKGADVNRDNKLSEQELLAFLDKKSKGKPFDRNIAKLLLQKMDKNRDGSVSLQEFIDCYVEGEIKLKERLNDIIKTMAERRRQLDEFKEMLAEARLNERLNKHGIMDNSILTVHVFQAEDLRSNESEGGSFEPYVILAIENQKIETRPVMQNPQQPVWDEKFTFEIVTGLEALQVIVVNKDVFSTNDMVGKCEIPLTLLSDQMRHDDWFDLMNPHAQDLKQSEIGGSIHLQLQWVFCRVKYFEQALKRVEETMQQEYISKQNIQEHLKQYRMPFQSLFDSEAVDGDSEIEQDQLELDAREGSSQAKLSVEEKKLSKKVELFAHGFAKKFGYETVPWFVLTQIVLGIYLVLTVLSMFFRPDFFNLTICAVGVYMIVDTDKIRKGTFRSLLYALCCSFAYDTFWLILSSSSYSSEKSVSDGGMEKNLRQFSLMMVYISIVFRFVVIFVFWKDSIDFQRIIKRRNQMKHSEV